MKRSALGSEGTAHSYVTERTVTLFWQSSLDYTRTPRQDTAIGHSRSGNRKQRVAATFITTSLRRNTRPLRQQKLVIGGLTNMPVCPQLKRTKFTLSGERLFHCGRGSKHTKKPGSGLCASPRTMVSALSGFAYRENRLARSLERLALAAICESQKKYLLASWTRGRKSRSFPV